MWRCAKELSDVTTRTRRKSLFYFGLPLISAFIYVSVHGWPILVILWQRGWETVEKSLPAIDIKKKSGKIMFYSCQTDDCSHVQILVKLTSPKNFHLQGKWSHKAQNIPSRRILFYQFFLGNSSAIFICVCPRANFLWFLFSWFEILGQAKKKSLENSIYT